MGEGIKVDKGSSGKGLSSANGGFEPGPFGAAKRAPITTFSPGGKSQQS